MSSLTFTQIMRNKAEFEKAKARNITATVNLRSPSAAAKRPKWAFSVLAYAGGKVEVFDDYTFANRWTQALGGGVVYPRDVVADYTPSSVTLKGMALHKRDPIEPVQLELL